MNNLNLLLILFFWREEQKKDVFRISCEKTGDLLERRNSKYFSSAMFYRLSRMRTRKDLCTLDKMLSLLPAPKHNFTPLSTVEKKTCKRGISAIFFGTRTIFIRAVPDFFCCVNGALHNFYAVRTQKRRGSNVNTKKTLG